MSSPSTPIPDDLVEMIGEEKPTGSIFGFPAATVIGLIAFVWCLFQLWIASPLPFMLGFGIIVDVPARSLHLAFAFLLCFLIYAGGLHGRDKHQRATINIILAVLGSVSAGYLFFGYEGIVARTGILLELDMHSFGIPWTIPFEAIVGGMGMVLLLEATRRSIGWPLVIVSVTFLTYAVLGQWMPELISHKGVSLTRLIGYQWFGGEAIFGIPISVSVSFLFLFVLFGALLDQAGAGRYFLNMAFALVGRYRGGPAKAAILASGMSGTISGSSIANVVMTGTFTIPVMKRTGLSAVKAGAIEVAASTNGQIMPPIMGAAAFIIAEFIGISYFEVVIAALIPALLSYIGLFYISHLEALKLNLVGLPKAEIPRLRQTFWSGCHFLIPIVILIYLLLIERWTVSSSIFYSILSLMLIILIQKIVAKIVTESSLSMALKLGMKEGVTKIYDGMTSGARSMVSIGIAVATAGIIVGVVSSTGLNNAMVGIVEEISGGNIYILLLLTIVLCLVLGMGLPTTANYIVVASLLAGVLVELGNAAGLVFPLIAIHLFVFYYGLLADSTPPVCLAAFAASAISRADPLKTGVQSFMYDIRTVILPLVFLFNTELLLIGVESLWHGLMVFIVSLLAILSFCALTQGWMFVRLKLFESALLVVVIIGLFRPDIYWDQLFPDYVDVQIQEVIEGQASIEPGQKVRFHVLRETPYGDRFRLFTFQTPQTPTRDIAQCESTSRDVLCLYGMHIEKQYDDRYRVTRIIGSRMANQAGVKYDDIVLSSDVEQPDQPSRAWIYPVMLLLLGVVVITQWRRRESNQ